MSVPPFRTDRPQAVELDAADPLAALRGRFQCSDATPIYLDGNSLGMLPTAIARRIAEVVSQEWGAGLVRSWGGWMELPERAGDLVGRELLGAAPGQVVVSDSTTVNLYKLACAALDARPGRPVLVTDDDNFPTDRYVLNGIARRHGAELRMIHADPDEGITRTPRWSACPTWPTAAARWPTWPGSARSCMAPGRWCSGTCATPRARSRSGWTSTAPTWPWAARTST